jgi:hypothetical protein
MRVVMRCDDGPEMSATHILQIVMTALAVAGAFIVVPEIWRAITDARRRPRHFIDTDAALTAAPVEDRTRGAEGTRLGVLHRNVLIGTAVVLTVSGVLAIVGLRMEADSPDISAPFAVALMLVGVGAIALLFAARVRGQVIRRLLVEAEVLDSRHAYWCLVQMGAYEQARLVREGLIEVSTVGALR